MRNARPNQQIVVYAHAGLWWVQPWPDHPFVPIKAGSTWSTETHLGFEFAALLVEPDYQQLPTTDVAPTQGGSVTLVTIVKRVGTPQLAPTDRLDSAVRIGVFAPLSTRGVIALLRTRAGLNTQDCARKNRQRQDG
jgi:hypothetical protein